MTQSSDDGAPRNLPKLARSHLQFPVVGMGASAGGLPALIKFLEHMPADSGMAYVVILHLSPKHQSSADNVLQRATSMPVIQVTEKVAIERDHVYVIPPNKHMSMNDGVLTLSDLEKPRGQHIAIDVFFRTLAEVHRERAIAVVLSGTGSDGAVGLERIKEQGGVTIVQDPADAEHDGMPNAAIATESVDFVLPAAEIPQKLIDLWSTARNIHLPALGDGDSSITAEAPADRSGQHDEEALQRVIAMLCANTGHDFRHYKRATVLRRIERRLQVRGVTTLPEYCRLLDKEPAEFKSLLQDMLIGVTNFFRDREAFESLERDVVPLLFQDKLPAEQVRVWVAACATGQEAYSMTMMLADHAAQLAKPAEIQVFASDIDEHAISVARAGVYPAAITMDVPASRMRQFFTKEEDRYRIRKAVRDRILFASHNLLRDPPFSKLDMISCRNLLIYLNRDVQLRVMEMFHSALKPDGFLFLGSSESADAASEFFVPFDKKNRIYRARPISRALRYLPALTPGPVNRMPELLTASSGGRRQFSYAEVHQRALSRFAPPSLVVDRESNIVHMSDAAGRFLRHVGGEPSRNVLQLVLPELRLELRTALYQALQSGTSVEGQRVLVKREDRAFVVNVIVRPFVDDVANAEFALLLFEEIEQTMNGVTPEAQAQHQDVVLHQLEAELLRSKEKLQETIEHAEVSNEELRASNEELQAINEELRSATEELETSKEELQSVNEELITVNYELKVKVEETGKANDDLNNLIASTDIATIFVDRALRIKRFTPRAADIFSIIPSDIGRSLLDITHRLDYDMLAEDVSATFETLRLVEREVRSNDGRFYIVRLLPYRTTEDKIEGAVMTFFDISSRREAEEKVRASEEWIRRVAANKAAAEGVPLQTMAEARDEFLSVMSQELRHPLNLIYINAELLARMPEVHKSLPALRAAAIIRNSVAAQARIIDDLAEMSRLHAGKLAMSCRDEDLGEIARRLVELLRSSKETETVDLRLDLPVQPVVVYADAVRLEQVLLNLLNNALRFTPAGGTVTLSVRADAGEARIDVADTGEGISTEALPHIFDIYSRGSAAAMRNKGGLGIGLALVRQIVELHGGRVDASSAGLGEGSTFSVWLPLSRITALPVSGDFSPLASCVSGRSVLLLDSEEDTSGMFKALLELDGASVRVAAMPSEALKMLELERFDLLIADIAMPGMAGHGFIREVRALPDLGTLPAIAISGMGRERDVQAALDAGYTAHITKPLSLDVLCGKLGGMLAPIS